MEPAGRGYCRSINLELIQEPLDKITSQEDGLLSVLESAEPPPPAGLSVSLGAAAPGI